MKKIFYLIAGILSLLLSIVLVVLLVFFIDPTVIINEKNITWALERSKVLETWSWKKMEIEHDWKKWNERHLTGNIEDFCFRYRKEGTNAYSCFSEVSWDFDLLFSFKDMFETRTYKPFVIRSPQIELALAKSEKTEESSPPDVYRMWKILWSGVVPDMDVKLESIKLVSAEKTQNFDFMMVKRAKFLKAETMKITFIADPDSFEIKGPSAIEIPEKMDTLGPFFVRNITLNGKVTRNDIPLTLTGGIEEAAFQVTALLDLPLKDDLSGPVFRRNFLSTMKGEIRVPEFMKTYSKRAPADYSMKVI